MSELDPTLADRAFDAQFATLPPIDPPAAVELATLDQWRSERRQTAFRTRTLAVAGMVLMAAMALLVAQDTPVVGAPGQMVERGTASTLPAVSLKVSVRTSAGTVERLAVNRRYAAGETLMFRVVTPASAQLVLRREATVLWSGELPAGEHDLPVGYALEPGEGPARFVLEGGAEAITLYLPAVVNP